MDTGGSTTVLAMVWRTPCILIYIYICVYVYMYMFTMFYLDGLIFLGGETTIN